MWVSSIHCAATAEAAAAGVWEMRRGEGDVETGGLSKPYVVYSTPVTV